MPSWLARLRPRGRLSAAESKASKTGRLIAFQAHGQPVWTPRNYQMLAREGYARNAVVHRCVRMIAEAAASVPLVVFEAGHEMAESPLAQLLARPNPRQSGVELLESLYGHLLVAGNAYAEVVRVEGAPRELHALRPDRMTLVPGPDGWPEGFDYKVAGRSHRFAAHGADSPILHLKLFHPADDHYGLSPLEAAQVALDIHNAAGAWNKALLDNAARPSGALVYAAEGTMTETQFDRLKAELTENFAGAANAGRPMLLEGGLDWKAIGLSPKDMDFIEAKNMAAREIALCFGVPPMLLGIPGDNTYANFREANLALWRQTVLPLVTRTVKALSPWLADDDDTRIGVDLDQVEALATDREALWARLEAATFLSEDEKRSAVGYGPKGDTAAAPEGARG